MMLLELIRCMDFVTIASTGNATDFGNLATARFYVLMDYQIQRGGMAAGGPEVPSNNVIEYITMASTGNAVDFGDLGTGERQMLVVVVNIYKSIISQEDKHLTRLNSIPLIM